MSVPNDTMGMQKRSGNKCTSVHTNAFLCVWQTESPILYTTVAVDARVLRFSLSVIECCPAHIEDVNDVRADELGLQMNGEY